MLSLECIAQAIDKHHAGFGLAQAYFWKVVNDDGEIGLKLCPVASYITLHVAYDTDFIPVHVLRKSLWHCSRVC